MAVTSPGVCIVPKTRSTSQQPYVPLSIASRTRFQLGRQPLANRSHVRVRVPEHVARWLWLQLGPRRLAACVASAPELRDRTLFVSSVGVDSGQCSDVLLSLGVEAVAVVQRT
jgi:hypothetical protein